MPKKKTKPAISFGTLLTLGLIVIFFTVIYFSLPWGQPQARAERHRRPPQAVACTMDAKECPDGSFVGRVAPRCNWAPCPEL